LKSHLKHQWFETFFQGPAVDFWTRAMTPALTLADVDFLVKTFDVKPGSRLLDVPCGNGRHSIELARRGYRTTGIDLSDEFLDAARSQLDADWRKGDIRALALESSGFDGAFCFGNSFGYLDHAGVAAFLSALAAALKPGARLVIETGMAAESILPALAQKRWHRLGDLLILSENRYDP
jgi:cyclopropane fatty-acyl-phospholipid synthase-like methyltransferase